MERKKAARQLVDAIKRFQDAVDLFDATAARALAINTTDLRCLTALRDRGPMTAGAVATSLGLTRGATTTALDRLEARGFLSRSAHTGDGRSVIIALTEEGTQRVDATWGPMRRRGGEHLRSYSVAELHLVRRFFDGSVELQTVCTESLRRGETWGGVPAPRMPPSKASPRRETKRGVR